jgi:hypothetical protein
LKNRIHFQGKHNVDRLLDEYNKWKALSEQTGKKEYKDKVDLYLGIMKAVVFPVIIKIGPAIPFERIRK